VSKASHIVKILQLLQNKPTNKLAHGVAKHLPMGNKHAQLGMLFTINVPKKDTTSLCAGQRKQQ